MRRCRSAALALTLAAARAAHAGGGAHVIDDAGVEDAGGCHLESWRTEATAGSTSVLAPACTPTGLPFLELGGSIARTASGGHATLNLSLTPKLALPLPDGPIGIALSPNITFDTRRARLASAGLVAPLSFAISDRVALNVDTGIQWTRGARPGLFAGAQIEAALTESLSLMAESFVRPDERIGQQVGLRSTLDRGRIDLDLLAGRRVDGRSPLALTLGLTIRR